MGELCVPVDHWFPSAQPRLWHEQLPVSSVNSGVAADILQVQSFELFSSRRKHRVSGNVQLQIGFLPGPAEDTQDALRKVQGVYETILARTLVGGQFGVLGVPAHEGIGTVQLTRSQTDGDDFLDTSTGMSVITTAVMAPSVGAQQSYSRQYSYDLPDDGLSSSDEDGDMEDALEGDDDGWLRDGLPTDSPEADGVPQSEPLSLPPIMPGVDDLGSRRSSAASLQSVAEAAPPSGKSRKIFRRSRLGRKKGKSKDYNFGHDHNILGIVVMEVQSASDLPRLKNALRVGWDMDPFVVISFGKKVFRTRVIRHSLNPNWDEKLLFHVHEHEENFTIQMTLLDWDKISGNDHIGSATLPLAELIADAPSPDPVTGLYGEGVDGKHESREFTLPIVTNKSVAWELKHKPALTVRAKYEPYGALRQRFWRQYAMQYDADDTGSMSWVEMTSMLDSLGSTLTPQTLESYFTRFGKSPEKDELTFDEVVQSLEDEVTKSSSAKRTIGKPNASVEVDAHDLDARLKSMPQSTPGSATPSVHHSQGTAPPSTYNSHSRHISTASNTNIPYLNVENTDDSSSPQGTTEAGSPMASDADENSDPANDYVERIINIKECPLCHRPRLSKRSEQDMITHLAVCASSDWSRIDRIMTSTYVTSSQAQRKKLTKLLNKVTAGSYSLGANSANILVQDRMTGQLQEEKMAVYVRTGIRVLYKGPRTGIAGARARRMLKSLSIKQGIRYDSPQSAADIPGFIAFHRLNTDEIRDPLDSFKTFNEFFYRKLKEDARPVEDPGNPDRLVSMADCRMMAFNTVSEAQQIWIKGRDFTIAKMLGSAYHEQWQNYVGGSLCIFRLAPQDYHRFHSPVDGKIGKITKIEGEYYTVNPQAIRTQLDVYGDNVRQIVPIESPQFGTVMTVWVGAMMVGSIVDSVVEGQEVKRGDELGYFKFGGSTIVCVFEPGRVVWDQDLQDNAAAALETLVRVGMGIGRTPEMARA